ncbi:membrane protein [Gordonia phage Powerball]|uniref:Membrane protein n=1 Tax=Gordonia phage Powerball TaxID=2599847 RepID=A0A5J6TU84_9CAUD|nr:membrane protein [Gordonia phage Powerball]QFG13459.1 membrane protein [Gordonia phage Powerball]
MSPELIAAIGGVITAFGAVITGVLATRSRVKLDDIATLHARIDELDADLAAEREARDRDADQHRARHAAVIADYERELADLKERLRQRDRTINHLDRVVLALRTYVARARKALLDSGITPPADIDGMND